MDGSEYEERGTGEPPSPSEADDTRITVDVLLIPALLRDRFTATAVHDAIESLLRAARLNPGRPVTGARGVFDRAALFHQALAVETSGGHHTFIVTFDAALRTVQGIDGVGGSLVFTGDLDPNEVLAALYNNAVVRGAHRLDPWARRSFDAARAAKALERKGSDRLFSRVNGRLLEVDLTNPAWFDPTSYDARNGPGLAAQVVEHLRTTRTVGRLPKAR